MAVALGIGTIELLSVAGIAEVDLSLVGFVVAGLFLATWAVAVAALALRGEPVMSDEYFLDTPVVRDFIADVRGQIAARAVAEAACEAIRPRFAALLDDPEWLPGEFREGNPESGMGGGIGQWLLFRAEDRSLTLFALVVPPGSQTPVHDHLAWGLVGLYQGTQDEEIFSDGPRADRAPRAGARRLLRAAAAARRHPPRRARPRRRRASPSTC